MKAPQSAYKYGKNIQRISCTRRCNLIQMTQQPSLVDGIYFKSSEKQKVACSNGKVGNTAGSLQAVPETLPALSLMSASRDSTQKGKKTKLVLWRQFLFSSSQINSINNHCCCLLITELALRSDSKSSIQVLLQVLDGVEISVR